MSIVLCMSMNLSCVSVGIYMYIYYPCVHCHIVRLPRHISILCVGWTTYIQNVTEKQERQKGPN